MKTRSRAWFSAMVCSGLITGCAADDENTDEQDALAEETALQATAVIGEPLPGVDADEFATAKEAFVSVEEIEDGVGPVFNERACGNCHFQGATGGAGTQIERRFGTFYRDSRGRQRFDPLANDGLGQFPARGGSLRQLFTVGAFTGAGGQTCNVPLEREPPEATIHDVGRQTTPLFGLGLVDSLPDSVFDDIARSQPQAIRGVVNRVAILLPNISDPNQRVGETRVGRFGWKAGVATLTQFSADAYVNEMGITTQHCVRGASILTFATESQPNGVAQAPGCDDLAPPQPAGNGVPAGTDDAVGSCAGGLSEIQDDVAEFAEFMTLLGPPPRGRITDAVNRGRRVFSDAGCSGCHLTRAFQTPANPANGVPGNLAFFPFSDFLVHDMGDGGDFIGNFGDPIEATRRMRTAPLWGIRFRTQLMHDGSAPDVPTAVLQHKGQGADAADRFRRLSRQAKADLVAFVLSR